MKNKYSKISQFIALSVVTLSLIACGGGGGGSDADNNTVRTWQGAEQLNTSVLGNGGFKPQIAFDNNGNALAVWDDGNGKGIWWNRFDGSSWGSVGTIISTAGIKSFSPQIAFDNNGNAFAVWSQSEPNSINNDRNIMASRFNGEIWSDAKLIHTKTLAGNAQIAVDNDGNALAIWSEVYNNTNDRHIMASRFNGEIWSSAEPIDIGPSSASDLKIAMDNDGKAFAVWSQSSDIKVNRFDGSTWGSAVSLSNNPSSSGSPEIAIDADGNAFVVWTQSSSIWTSRFINASWSAPEPIGDNDAGSAYEPQITMDNSGNALAVWTKSNDVWANHFDGINWSGPNSIEDNETGGDTDEAQVAMDNNGNALAVWVQHDGNRDNIWVNHFDDNGWGDAALLEVDNSNLEGAQRPKIAMDNNGNALAVWRQVVNSGRNIMANHFK